MIERLAEVGGAFPQGFDVLEARRPLIDPLDPFVASELKLQRAVEHIGALKIAVKDYLDRGPLVVRVETLPGMQTKHQAWVARLTEAVPVSISNIVGDSVHNIRSSLDLMACDLVRLNGRSDRGVSFPFSADAASFSKEVKNRRMNHAAQDVLGLLRSLKPYVGGNRMLRAVHDLDLQDKHRTLIPTVGSVRTPEFQATITPAAAYNVKTFAPINTPLLMNGQPIVIFSDVSNMALGSLIPCSYSLVFDEETALEGDEVVDALERLRQEVCRIVEIFKGLCSGLRFPEAHRNSLLKRSVSVFVVKPTTS